MSRSLTCFWTSLLAAAVLAGPAHASEPGPLLRFFPANVNTVAVINVNSILTSPRAVKEGWAKQDHVEYLAGAVPVHPSVQRIVLGKEIDPHAPGRGTALAVVPLQTALDLEKFAKMRGGHVDTVSGESVAVTNNGTVGVKLGDTILGLVRTDNRQEVSRWIKSAKTATTSQLGRYLNATIHNFGTRHHIVIAIETEDLFHPKEVGLAVAQSKVFEGNREQAEAIERYLNRLNGVRLAINIVADGITAEFRLDAAVAANVNPEFVKAFLIDLLDRNGAGLEDIGAAAARADGNAVTLTFRLSDPELARVMAVVAPPIQGIAEADTVSIAPKGVNHELTRRYFRTVNKILDDLQVQNKRAQDFNKTAVWHDTAANRIETLSVLNVDPIVVQYGVGVAYTLRSIADSLRGVPIQTMDLEGQAYVMGFMPRTSVLGRGGFRLNPFMAAGPQSIQTNLPEIRQKQAAVIKQDAANRGKLWDQIEQQRSETRRTVAQKSLIDLDAPDKK